MTVKGSNNKNNHNSHGKNGHSQNSYGADITSIDVSMTSASEIESQPITWLWDNFLPIGTVSILFGEGGEGKSFMALALAAAVSKGLPLPGMESASLPPSDVIIQNAENPWPMVIKPRLEMLGADCSKIHRINDEGNRLTLTDERIEAAIRKYNVKLTIIDPIQSHLPSSMSMGRAESVRPMLTHLEKVAERTQSTILLVGHVTKGNGKAQHRGLGSIDIINSVPCVMYLGRAEGLDRDVRAVAQGKNNLSEIATTQLFKLNKASGFQWIGESDVTPDDILGFNAKKSKEAMSKVDEAADFLLEILSDADSMSANDVMELANEEGISKRTLMRAKDSAGVVSKRIDGRWVWSL